LSDVKTFDATRLTVDYDCIPQMGPKGDTVTALVIGSDVNRLFEMERLGVDKPWLNHDHMMGRGKAKGFTDA